MTDTWGIPGPLFTGLYLGLLLIPLLYAVVRTSLLARGHAGGAPRSVEELALLTGGPGRVGEVVVAGLLERQFVRMDGTGRLHRVTGRPADELGRVAVDRVGKTGSSVDRVRAAVSQHRSVTELAAGLVGRGLLADTRKLRLTWTATSIAYWVLFALGIARLVAGASAGHAVGYLLGLLVLNLVAAVVVTVRAANAPEAKATGAGRADAEEARRTGTLTSGATGTVASGGLVTYPDKDIRVAVSRATHAAAKTYDRRARRSRWASAGGGAAVGYYGGSSCGGGGSSCGGGGGGGSSCGGGGGGGCGG
ncbi:TIGR04222 domain-containing membrane protein [Amycolatopsis sp. WQ 127309]|uniref:TIGR04222 domain-containing membrane protein n=1 Tax=Amycolatopsis sp. WQ 127309 TaxID=2932773 RepID=UPI001FF4E388|nr:TIGR04222 domain-containing membrane protein [Amycolatopsis sp. WQ 127309]UOZ02433.1 TIGR04222 domain-containing membrane protein [Amycolatopsis sp. WQ 127309]